MDLDRPFEADELDDVNHKVNYISSHRKKRVKRKFPTVKSTKICTALCRFPIVRSTARKFGMSDVSEYHDWNIFWTDVFPSLERCHTMKRYQRINHFPGMLEICRKDCLARSLRNMLKLFPKDYNFSPSTWCLPEDVIDMMDYAKRNPGKTYILKPCRGSEGRGISITKNPKHFRTKYNMIGQLYINKPLLIDGFKFDFRIYVLITSCDPLRIYVYNEGLARFATKKYEPTKYNLNQKFMHLTNYSVNKRSEDFIIDDDEGSKRKLSTINDWFTKKGYDVTEIWDLIDDIVIKTLLIVLPKLKHYYRLCFPHHVDTYACFELLGFDFMLDRDLKPYLLEVNYTPSFNRNTPVDRSVKDALLADIFRLANLSRNEKVRINNLENNCPRPPIWNQIRELSKRKARYEQTLKAQASWEMNHKGNFRKVYPCPDSARYKPFLKSTKSQIFPKTFAPLITEEDYDKEKIKGLERQSWVPRQNPFIEGEKEKSDLLEFKDPKINLALLLKSHNLIESVYTNLKRSDQKRVEMEITMGRDNRWDLNEMCSDEYKCHRETLTTGVSAVLKTISSRRELSLSNKQKLSSIFLNPSTLHSGNRQSHIGPIGPEIREIALVEEANTKAKPLPQIRASSPTTNWVDELYEKPK